MSRRGAALGRRSLTFDVQLSLEPGQGGVLELPPPRDHERKAVSRNAELRGTQAGDGRGTGTRGLRFEPDRADFQWMDKLCAGKSRRAFFRAPGESRPRARQESLDLARATDGPVGQDSRCGHPLVPCLERTRMPRVCNAYQRAHEDDHTRPALNPSTSLGMRASLWAKSNSQARVRSSACRSQRPHPVKQEALGMSLTGARRRRIIQVLN